LLTLTDNNAFPFTDKLHAFFQQYITVGYCHVNATMGSIYIVVEQNFISYCYQQYTCTWVFM